MVKDKEPNFLIYTAIGIASAGILYMHIKNKQPSTPTPPPTSPPPTTTQPPDGTYTVTLVEGQRDGPLLVQKIYPYHIEGLQYIEYPLPFPSRSIVLYVGQSVSNGCTITLTLTDITQLQVSPPTYQAVFSKTIDTSKPCPICLTENTTIDTPSGQVPIKYIREGDIIWTSDIYAHKQIAKIIKTTKTQVKNHQVSHIVLDDDREINISPNHPMTNDKPIGSVLIGDTIDNSKVIISELVQYKGDYTYDILPSSDTGTYWANRILLKSSITRH